MSSCGSPAPRLPPTEASTPKRASCPVFSSESEKSADAIHREEWNGPGAGDRSFHGRGAADQAGEMAEPGLGGGRDAIDRADERGQPAL